MRDIELYNDSFQNYKSYQIPKAQLIIVDVPYQLDTKAYGFEVNKEFFKAANEKLLQRIEQRLFI